MPWIGGNVDERLCEQHERSVGHDNWVRFDNLILQIPQDRYRCNYVKTKVKVRRYADGSLSVFHGPRQLARYRSSGVSVCSTPSGRSTTMTPKWFPSQFNGNHHAHH